MELEEAIIIVNDLKEDVALFSTGWKNRLKDTEKQAIETVLQALEKLQKHCKEMIKEKQELSSALLDSIPKKKIEDKIEELKEEFKNYKVDVNCSQDNYYELSDKYAFAEEKLRELLEE